MGAMDEILNNEKQVVLLLKGYVSMQLSILINKEAGLLSCSLLLSLLCLLSQGQIIKSEYKY